MMNTIFQMPSWKTGIQKRLARIPFEQIRDAVLVLMFFVALILFMAVPIVFAFIAPPTLEIGL